MTTRETWKATSIPRRALQALGLVLLPLALAGQVAAEEPVRFLIERIVVEGMKRASAAEIVAAESRLAEGQEYTEQQLREAVYRVKRLPFVLDAELSLRKGSERGAYELVIAVEETRPVFVTAEAIGARQEGPDPFRRRQEWEWDGFGGVGLRAFVGSWGVAFATLDLEDGVQAGYTRYNLFGRGGFASTSLLLADLDDRAAGFLAVSVSAGVPLVGNHSLRTDLTYSHDEFESDFPPRRQRTDAGTAGVEWRYDTTDDPFLPSRGLLTTAAVDYARAETSVRVPAGEPGPIVEPGERTAESWRIELAGTRHWPLSPRQSVSLDSSARAFRTTAEELFVDLDEGADFSLEQWEAGVGAGYALALWGPAAARRWGDLRLETRLGLDYADPSGDVLALFDPQTVASARAAIVFRNAWAVLRLGLEYRRLDGDLQEGVFQ